MERLTEREGVAAIAILAMFADGVVKEEEDEILRERLSSYPLFEGTSEGDLGRMLERMESLSHEDGGEPLLRAACAVASTRLGATAFILAAEIVASDGEIAPEESEFLRRLQPMLRVPPSVAQKVLDVVKLRCAR